MRKILAVAAIFVVSVLAIGQDDIVSDKPADQGASVTTTPPRANTNLPDQPIKIVPAPEPIGLIDTSRRPEAPAQPGPRGFRGQRGPRGPRGLAGRPTNNAGVYHELKSWDPASMSFVEARERKLRAEMDQKLHPAKPQGSASTNPVAGGNRAEEKEMIITDVWNPLTVCLVILALILVGTGVWFWGNLVHNRGLHSPNHQQTGGFTPDLEKWGEFHDQTTKSGTSRHAISNEAIHARANSAAEIAHCRLVEVTARAQQRAAERAQMLSNYAQPVAIGQIQVIGRGETPGERLGPGRIVAEPETTPEAGPPRYTADELRTLGVIRDPQQPAANPPARQRQQRANQPAGGGQGGGNP